MKPTDFATASQRILELEKALAREREVSSAERLRADLLRDSVRRAYQMAADAHPHTRHTTKDGGS